MVVGVRRVGVSAAGRIAGFQAGIGLVSATPVMDGSPVGGSAGPAAEQVPADSAAFEYIVRKPDGDLVSVTQTDKVPLVLGQTVLVIAGNRARVVPD